MLFKLLRSAFYLNKNGLALSNMEAIINSPIPYGKFRSYFIDVKTILA